MSFLKRAARSPMVLIVQHGRKADRSLSDASLFPGRLPNWQDDLGYFRPDVVRIVRAALWINAARNWLAKDWNW